jgi:hypothetical protein
LVAPTFFFGGSFVHGSGGESGVFGVGNHVSAPIVIYGRSRRVEKSLEVVEKNAEKKF